MHSQDEAEQRRCVEAAAAELRQILGGKRLPRGGVYIPGPKPGMGGPPQVSSHTAPLCIATALTVSLRYHLQACIIAGLLPEACVPLTSMSGKQTHGLSRCQSRVTSQPIALRRMN